jgi:hypothetical protein
MDDGRAAFVVIVGRSGTTTRRIATIETIVEVVDVVGRR